MQSAYPTLRTGWRCDRRCVTMVTETTPAVANVLAFFLRPLPQNGHDTRPPPDCVLGAARIDYESPSSWIRTDRGFLYRARALNPRKTVSKQIKTKSRQLQPNVKPCPWDVVLPGGKCGCYERAMLTLCARAIWYKCVRHYGGTHYRTGLATRMRREALVVARIVLQTPR